MLGESDEEDDDNEYDDDMWLDPLFEPFWGRLKDVSRNSNNYPFLAKYFSFSPCIEQGGPKNAPL